MNLSDLESMMWNYSMYQDATSQQDWRRQMFRDFINATLRKACSVMPDQLGVVRESTLAIVSGTGTYTLDDWARRSESIYTVDSSAHKLICMRPRNADRNFMRNPGMAASATGPFFYTRAPNVSTPYRSGASGASTGASAVNNSTSVTLSGADATCVGRMLKLNGEYADYKITAASGGGVTVDRPIYCRLNTQGTTTSALGANYTNVRWEIGPKGVCQIQILPTPMSSKSVPYRFCSRPRHLLWPDETPDIDDDYHDLIWKGAMHQAAAFMKDKDAVETMGQEFAAAMSRWTAEDAELQDSEDAVNYEGLTVRGFVSRLNPDVNPPRAWQ